MAERYGRLSVGLLNHVAAKVAVTAADVCATGLLMASNGTPAAKLASLCPVAPVKASGRC